MRTWLVALIFLVSVSMPVNAGSNVAVVSLGLFGAQSVFESEAKGAASIVTQRLGANPVIVQANTKKRGDLSIASIADTLQSVAERIDREHDVLFLILTSHGSPAGVAVQAGKHEQVLTPELLMILLNRAGVQHRVVVISACYSGVFIDQLANDDTLVITAADANHPSFGCQDKVKWTYFGDAFFNQALRRAADLRSAFAVARKLISLREMRYRLMPSNPQIAGGKNIDLLLQDKNAEERIAH
jgi:hypothetical protein